MKTLFNTGIGLACLAIISLSGCTRPTMLGPDPGLAYSMARDQQKLHPEGAPSLDPVLGLEDGPAAKRSMERYRSSFETPERYRTTITAPSIVGQGVGVK